tara:strand:- start:2763 stop:2942 length:180 start_codon:yes stop_codon:yes gene_type:complete
MDVQSTLETPAFQSMNQSALTPPAASAAPVNPVADVGVAKVDEIAPIESGKGAMVDTVA